MSNPTIAPTEMALPPELLQWLSSVLKPEYRDPNRTYTDVANALAAYPSLRPRTAVYTDEGGRPDLLLCLYGILPTFFNGAMYHIPVEIWVPKQYPLYVAPTIFVKPTEDMMISPNNFVDTNGKCYHPYLTYWAEHPQYNLNEMIGIFIEVFGRLPPVFARPRDHAPPSFSSTMASNSASNHPGVHRPVPVQGQAGGFSGDSPNGRSSSAQFPPPIPPKPDLPQYSNDHIAPQYSNGYAHTGQLSGQSYDVHNAGQYHGYTQDSRTVKRPETNCASIMDMDSTDALSLNSAAPPKLPNPEKELALEYLKDSLQAVLNETVKPAVDIDQSALEQTSQALDWAEKSIGRESDMTKTIIEDCKSNERILHDRIDSAKNVIREARNKQIPNIDDLIIAETVVYNQLYNTIASDRAIDDTFYVLDKAMDHDRIELSVYMKHTRALAREQFMKRALVNKISAKIGVV